MKVYLVVSELTVHRQPNLIKHGQVNSQSMDATPHNL